MKTKILSNLSPNHPWKEKIFWFDSITSTNDVLKQMTAQGAPHGTILIADQQTGGRGRRGRTFLSPAGVGIYMSILLRPRCRPAELMHLTCAAAEAMCNAVACSSGFRPGIKWTNDIVFRGRKLAGVLTELGFDGSGNVDYAIIGIGVNCMQSESDFDSQIRGFAGSLSMFSGNEAGREKVAAAMIDAFFEMDQRLFSEKRTIMDAYRKDCVTLGQEISIVKSDCIRHGKALDIDEDGALIVCYDDGTIGTVNSGEVSIRGMYGYV